MALKRKNIVWRDLKGQNLLVTSVKGPISSRVKLHAQAVELGGNRTATTNGPAAKLKSRKGKANTPYAAVEEVAVVMSDWGGSVKLPSKGKRRMTLHG